MALLALAVLTCVSWAPVVLLIVAGTVASALGCALDEGSVHPCLFGGQDIGEILYTGAVLGWATFVTWPGMLASLLLWGWLFGRWMLRRRGA